MTDTQRSFCSIRYGSRTIFFELEYRKRKTMEISVYPDLSVKVVAPQERTLEEIKDKIRKRASWILEQKYFFSLFLPKQPPRSYVSGETHTYLGRQCRLKVIESSKERVEFHRGILTVYAMDRKDSSKVKSLLESWYRERALSKLQERIKLCCGRVRKYGIEEPVYRIQRMAKRWGSCSKNRRLLLNTLLVKAPSHCMDYVIIHELCHLKYFNHSKEFYDLLNRIMPDWEARKKRLEQVIL